MGANQTIRCFRSLAVAAPRTSRWITPMNPDTLRNAGEGSGLHLSHSNTYCNWYLKQDWKQWRLCALYARSGPTANRQQEIHFAFAVVQVVAESRWIGVTLDSLVAVA